VIGLDPALFSCPAWWERWPASWRKLLKRSL
jgi:hypothetical protein